VWSTDGKHVIAFRLIKSTSRNHEAPQTCKLEFSHMIILGINAVDQVLLDVSARMYAVDNMSEIEFGDAYNFKS